MVVPISQQKKFVIKAYKILISSLIISAISAYIGVLFHFPFSLWWLGLDFIVFIACLVFKKNYFLLYLWAIITGFTSMPIFTNLLNGGNENIIWLSLCATSLLFIILTYVASKTKSYFSRMKFIGLTFLIIFLFSSLLVIIYPTYMTEILYSTLGILCFSAYVVYDTVELLNTCREGDEVMFALELHLDILFIFEYFVDFFKIIFRRFGSNVVDLLDD